MTEDLSVLINSDLPLPPFIRGKVRDSYELGDHLLIIATDRISAFDVILKEGIPAKGEVLSRISAFWFDMTKNIVPNHLIEIVEDVKCLDAYLPAEKRFDYPGYLSGRSMVVKKVERLPVECVARGYISGSAWAEYRKSGTVQGDKMPAGILESQELPEPMFTPSTKADSGHDMPMTMDEMKELVGGDLAEEIKEKTMAVYNHARKYAAERGIIIADTKLEYGLDDGKLILIDELLTPDSSRFWEASAYRAGQSQPSYDKQPVRDWLENAGWNKEPPPPALPTEVVEATSKRYRDAYEKLAGKKLK